MSPSSETERFLEHLVFEIAKGVAGETGQTFFRLLVLHLARALDVDFVFIGALRSGGERVVTLAVHGLAETAPTEYRLAGTPSEQVVQKKVGKFPGDVQQLFPQDVVLAAMGAEGYVGASMTDSNGRSLGFICAVTKRPMRNANLVEALLKIFAARAGTELERKNYEDALAHNEERFRALVEHGTEGVIWFKLEQPVSMDLSEDEQIELFYRHAYMRRLQRPGGQALRLRSSRRPNRPAPGGYDPTLRSRGNRAHALGDSQWLEHSPKWRGRFVGAMF